MIMKRKSEENAYPLATTAHLLVGTSLDHMGDEVIPSDLALMVDNWGLFPMYPHFILLFNS